MSIRLFQPCLSACISIFFFFLILRPPPRSTLFPYTTLFRSTPEPSVYVHPGNEEFVTVPCCRHGHGAVEVIVSWKDRKSTRLNSSHDQISYAVFCLKKKKTKHTQHNHNHKQVPYHRLSQLQH